MSTLIEAAVVPVGEAWRIPYRAGEWVLQGAHLSLSVATSDELDFALSKREDTRTDFDSRTIVAGRLKQTLSDGALRKVVGQQYMHLWAFYALAKHIHTSDDEGLSRLALYGITGYVFLRPIYRPLAVTLISSGIKKERRTRLIVDDAQTRKPAHGIVWLERP